jgi:hypothetical protein
MERKGFVLISPGAAPPTKPLEVKREFEISIQAALGLIMIAHFPLPSSAYRRESP